MDTQTVISIVIGVVVSVATFWLGYRRTVGAFEERIRNANSALTASVVKRIAVERETMSSPHYALLKRAKAYSLSIDIQKLLTFADAKAIVFSEIIDNNFLDQASKNAIIDLLDKSGLGGEEAVIDLEPETYINEIKANSFQLLAFMSGVIGLGVALVLERSQTNQPLSIFTDVGALPLIVFTITATAAGAYFVLRSTLSQRENPGDEH